MQIILYSVPLPLTTSLHHFSFKSLSQWLVADTLVSQARLGDLFLRQGTQVFSQFMGGEASREGKGGKLDS